MLDNIQNSLLHTLYTVSRHQHLDAGLVLAAEALQGNLNLQLVTIYNLGVDDSRRIVLSVHAVEQRLSYNGLTQIPLNVALRNTCIDGISQIAALNVQILADLKEDDGHAGILADRTILCPGNLGIADDLIQNITANRRLLGFPALLQCLIYILRQIIGSFLAHLRYFSSNLLYINCTQSKPSLNI